MGALANRWPDAGIAIRYTALTDLISFDIHLPLLIDDQLIGEQSQSQPGDTPWFVHFQTGVESSDRTRSFLSCLVADNNDHGKPNLIPESREYVARFGPPFAPSRIRIQAPGHLETFVCLITFELMREGALRTNIPALVDAPFVDVEEHLPSWKWQWREMLF